MSRLAAEIEASPDIFVALLAAFEDGGLVGIGGMTAEPDDGSARRMRRLFVTQAARRRGVARTLANALLAEALCEACRVTVHAGNPGAAQFWEAMGFAPVEDQPWSHEYAAT